ncbi:MAG: hypothetical protein KJI72_00180 [Patescibacteria group bacterium]|nr:hypothetical protein [Patescibacteria group bacterium]
MNGKKPTTRTMREVPDEWDRLMRVAAAINYGSAKVVFKDGKPVRIDAAIKQIKLDSEDDFNEGLKTIPL